MKVRCLEIFAFCFLITIIGCSCVSGNSAPKMELTTKYRILLAEVSDPDDLDSIMQIGNCIKVPTLYKVISTDSLGKMQERIDFVKLWTNKAETWYLIGKWNTYLKIEDDKLITSTELYDFNPDDQLVFNKLESHSELFAEPQTMTEKQNTYEWGGKGYVVFENLN